MGFFHFHPHRSLHRIPPLDTLSETDSEYTVTVEALGLNSDEITITVTDNQLNVSAKAVALEDSFSFLHQEKVIKEINQSFQFRKSIVPEGINAQLNHGVLEIKIPKKEPKTITISI
jgi:HSP20 family protein